MRRNSRQFRGTGVALVTPFKDGEIDFDALEKIIRHCTDTGVDYLVSLGTTGESVTLNTEEKHAVLDFTIKKNKGRLPIVAGFGGNDTRQVIQEMEAYHFEGVDAILSSSPAYNKPTQEGIFQHYMALAEVAPRPVIIYNVPGRTSSNISAETTLRLAHASKKFIAIKEASGNMNQATKIIKNKPENFLVISGDDPTALPLLSIGGDGVISVIANALAEPFAHMIRIGLNGDFQKAASLHQLLSDIHPWLYKDGNPAGIKAVMQMMNICSDEVRLPLVPIGETVRSALQKELEKIGMIQAKDLIA